MVEEVNHLVAKGSGCFSEVQTNDCTYCLFGGHLIFFAKIGSIVFIKVSLYKVLKLIIAPILLPKLNLNNCHNSE